MKYSFKAKLWIWPGGTANWHFITVPKKESADIKSKIKLRRGFGSVKVEVQLGKTKWETSIFPDSRSNTYLLPVKAKIRRLEEIDAGDEVSVVLKAKH